MDRHLAEIDNIQIVQPVIEFKEYEKLLSQVKQIANAIKTMDGVTVDDIKEPKKTLARVNKSIRALNDKRIEVKNKIMGPYEIFNNQIKEIEGIVKEADESVRLQVRDLEEKERQAKRKELEKIWKLRHQHYELSKIFTFEDWLTPQHLNKSTSLAKTEEDMTEFLEKSERELNLLSKMENSEDLILEYKQIKDVGITIELVNKRLEEKKANEKYLKDIEKTNGSFTFRVFGEKDKKLVEFLLRENSIEFEVI